MAHAGKGGYDAPAEHKAYSVVVDFITPETETSIHYFWGMARKFNPQRQGADGHASAKARARSSAKTWRCWSASRRTCWRGPQRDLLKLNIDTGGVQSRKILDRLMAEEQAAAQCRTACRLPEGRP